MTIYIKLDGDIITDVVTFEYEGYTAVEVPDEPLPIGINAGWFRWTGTEYQYDEELFTALNQEELNTDE